MATCARIHVAVATAALVAALPACGDDGDATTAAETSATGPEPNTTESTDDTTEGPATTADTTGDGPADSTTADATGSSSDGADTNDESSGTTGSGPAPIELINDSWSDGASAVFQGGFVQGECWASTYVPEPEHYPFVVDATTMLIGGTDKGAEDFSVGLWTVDENNQPDAEIGSGVIEFTGVDSDIDTFNFAIGGVVSPVFEEGNFAIVVCLVGHDNAPAIAADADRQVDFPDRNWIRIEDGTWLQSTVPGVAGDWIMRAIIVPSP